MEIADLQAVGHAPRRSARGVAASTVVLAVAGAGLVSGFVSWLLPPFASLWWLVPIVVVPAAVAATSVGQREGRAALTVTAVLAVAVCSAGAWLGWRPPPAVVGDLRAREAGATAVAEATLAAQAPGTCQPASSIELGPLADLGPWDQVCVWGGAGASTRGVEFQRLDASDRLELDYSTTGPITPGGCVAQVTARWWAVTSPSGNAADFCPRGFTARGSG